MVGQFSEQHSAQRRLHLSQPPIRSKGLVLPAESRSMLAVIDSVVTLTVVLERPSLLPQRLVIGHHQPTFAGGSHDLVLAERKCVEVPHGADLACLIRRAVRLSAIFYHFEGMLASQFEDRIHVARPTRKMNCDDRLCTRRKCRADGFSRDVLAI